MKIDISEMAVDGKGWGQTLVWLQQGKLRKEIFFGRSQAELQSAISERIAEIKSGGTGGAP